MPFWVGERDADAAENPELIGERQPTTPIDRSLLRGRWPGPGSRSTGSS